MRILNRFTVVDKTKKKQSTESPECCSSGIGHHGSASATGHTLHGRVPAFRLSLAREVLREIRSLLHRIAEIRRRKLDHRGICVDPTLGISIPSEQAENALNACIRDMQGLYMSRPATTLSDAELFAQGWTAAFLWCYRNASTLYPERKCP